MKRTVGAATSDFTTQSSRSDISAALGAIARTLQAEPHVEATLTAIVKACGRSHPQRQHAGISLVGHGHRIRTVAPADDVLTTIDAVRVSGSAELEQ